MSNAAIQEVLNELHNLPEADQEIVLAFLRALKFKKSTASVCHQKARNAALESIDGLLIFTGELEDGKTDWLKLVREERDDNLIRQALGNPPHE